MSKRLRPVRRVALVLAAAAATVGCAPSAPDSAIVLDSAELWLGPQRPDAASVGERVPLPDRWFLARRRRATEGWYRLEVDLAPGDQRFGVLMLRARLNVELVVNGTSLGRVGRFEPPIARSPGNPLYFPVPRSVLRAGRNTLLVRLATTAGFPGRLDPLWIGPEADLEPAHERLSLLLLHAPRLANFAAILFALTMLAQALTRRPDRSANALLGAAAGCMAIAGAGYWTAENPLPSRLWEWLIGSLTLWASLLLVLSAHRFGGLSRPLLERRLLALFALATVALGLVPHLFAFGVWVVWLVVAIGVYAYLVYLLVRGARLGQLHPSLPIVTFLAVAPWVGTSGVGFLAAALTLLWFVLARTFHRLRVSEEMNRVLEQRVAERETEVRRSYEKLRELERARAVAQERERLMRDMHDGTGGQLTSAIALARDAAADRDTLVGILQETLDDLRLTIESLDPGARDLPSVLGMLRASLERRLAPSRLRLVWQVGEAGGDLPLGSEAALHVIRIVQEAVTNTIKHSGAQKVTIQTREDSSGALVVEVRDDGHGAAKLAGGRGVANMRERAAAMGGRAELRTDAEGTLVRLFVPRPETPRQSSERTSPS